MSEKILDLVAASRISRRVDLRNIRLTEMRATSQPDLILHRHLQPSYDHDCVPVRIDTDVIEVQCSYNFRVKAADADLAQATLIYVITYGLRGEEAANESDIQHFAQANGAYHSWPFVREAVYGLTSKMGLSPYTLPVLSFQTGTRESAKPEEPAAGTEQK